eukprot:scaffold869_cov160-Ochromonas_danica.AAC.3
MSANDSAAAGDDVVAANGNILLRHTPLCCGTKQFSKVFLEEELSVNLREIWCVVMESLMEFHGIPEKEFSRANNNLPFRLCVFCAMCAAWHQPEGDERQISAV